MKRLIAFMNAYTQGESGGDIWFIEVAKRLGRYNKLVVTPKLGEELCERKGLIADYLITTKETEFKGVILTYLRRIFKVLFKRVQGDIFYATSDFLPDVLPSFLGKWRNPGAKWVQKIFHLIPASRPIPYYGQGISFMFIKRWADLVFVDNSLLKEELVKKGFGPDKIVINYPGIDIKFIQNVKPSEYGFDGVFLGRLKPSKGVFDLIEIWNLVCKERPGSRLGVIGHADRHMRDVMEKKIREFGLKENISLLGYLSNEKAFGIMKASKIFVFPSREEGFGIAIAEAMACGLPVVAYDLSVYKENFTKGIVDVPIGDVERFAEEVVDLLDDRTKYLTGKISNSFSWINTAEREMFYLDKLCRT